MSDDQRDFLDTITNYNIEARYPDDKEELSRTLTKKFCRQIIDETKQLQQWIKDKLWHVMKPLRSSADTRKSSGLGSLSNQR